MLGIIEPAEIPEPEETGSSGTQLTGAAEIVSPEEESPLKGLPIAQRVEGLAATRSRSLGGEVAAGLIAGSFAQLSYDLQTTRQELSITREELKRSLEELSDSKIKSAVLQERVNAYKRERHLKNLIITTGTALITFGIQFIRINLDTYGYILFFLGALLLIFGWFSKSEEGGR